MRSVREIQVVGALVAAVLFCLAGSAMAAKYGGGSGTADDPYQIWTPEQMNAIGAEPNDWDKHFKLMADIDLSAYDGKDGRPAFSIIGADTDPTEPGFQGVCFRGGFDGDSHAISGLACVSPDRDFVGLFGAVSTDSGTIERLRLLAPRVSGRYAVGSLVGELWYGNIIDCRVIDGTVCGDVSVGGLIGSTASRRGGPVRNKIGSCCFTGTVSARSFGGGLIGDSDGVSIVRSCASGETKGYDNIGGLVGTCPGGVLEDCYAIAHVVAEKSVGGLVGGEVGWITDCYAAGVVEGTEDVGGLVGYWSHVVAGSYWDVEASGQVRSKGGRGLLTREMQTSDTFTAWNACSGEAVWTIDEGEDYPRLSWEGGLGSVIQGLPLIEVLGGTGTQDDPYLIFTGEQLNAIGLYPCEWNKCFKLMADIDLRGFVGDQFNIIGEFEGTFDGNHHAIRNFTYRTASRDCVGLFGIVSGRGLEIKDLEFTDPNIDAGTGDYVGSLAGAVQGTQNITNCHVRGGRIMGEFYVGGLVGTGSGAIIQKCSCTAGISGKRGVGGLVGWNGGRIASCYAVGVVLGGSAVGGLVGYNRRTIADCYSAAAVSGDHHVGGLLGANEGTVTDCYSSGGVMGNADVGGLVGHNVESDSSSGLKRVLVAVSFWDVQTSGQLNSAGGIGLATADMQKAATFSTWNAWGDSVAWTIEETEDYPRLPWEDRTGAIIGATRLPGAGTAEQPYLIHTAEALEIISLYPSKWYAHFRLMADIDLSTLDDRSFRGIGMGGTPFTGVFDGQGHTISNLFCREIPLAHTLMGFGFFGAVGDGTFNGSSEIRNLRLANVDVEGDGAIGGLAGYVGEDGAIINCGSTGRVAGYWAAGGLVGFMTGRAKASCCCSTASVVATYDAGGLVGWSSGQVENCYARGSVTGDDAIGGLVGNNYGSIRSSYSTGFVQGDTNAGGLVGESESSGSGWNSLWDVETSGQAASRTGRGKTTVQMQTAETYTYLWWDFAGVSDDRTEDIWWIEEGRDYPRLWWEVDEKDDGTTASDD